MARALRARVAGGIYHVYARGNRRQAIFLDGEDFAQFLAFLDDVVARYGWRLHAYCLMPNHYHLLVETPNNDLSAGMHRLNSLYAMWFNDRHGVDGHLFQGRFSSVLLESNWHLLELSRYVVLNPVRAGLCEHPVRWRWSSYRATTGKSRRPRYLQTAWLLAQFGRTPREARAAYGTFVAAALARSPPGAPAV
jgi:putative transposase